GLARVVVVEPGVEHELGAGPGGLGDVVLEDRAQAWLGGDDDAVAGHVVDLHDPALDAAPPAAGGAPPPPPPRAPRRPPPPAPRPTGTAARRRHRRAPGRRGPTGAPRRGPRSP